LRDPDTTGQWPSIDRWTVVVGGRGVVIIGRRQRAQRLVEVAFNEPELFIRALRVSY